MKLHVINTYWGVEDGAVHSERRHQVEVECSVPRPARFRRDDAVDSHWIAAVAARPLGPLCSIPPRNLEKYQNIRIKVFGRRYVCSVKGDERSHFKFRYTRRTVVSAAGCVGVVLSFYAHLLQALTFAACK